MNWKRLDRARRNASPLELDLIEHYAAGKISRRDFVKRGTIIGLATPAMASVIAACGDDGGSTTPSDDDTADTGDSTGGPAAAGGNISVGIQTPSSTLDPIAMLDLGTYSVLSQSFEYLVGGELIDITGPALATAWETNEDGSVWTFDLRQDVKWQDGSDFTSADVAATMDRLAEANNAGLGGIIDVGSTDSSDPAKAVISLLKPNGNFPVLVSNFNAQALITPVDYETGTTLDSRPAGTGAFILDSYTEGQSAKFSRNPNWWGGTPPLDTVELQQFETSDTAVTALRDGSLDAIQQFSVVTAESLLDDENFVVQELEGGAHRQVWFNTQQGQFTDPRVRRAMATTFDRNEMVDLLFSGHAQLGNDHPVLASAAFYDPDAVPQRERNIEEAMSLLADAGVADGLASAINHGELQEIPDLAAIIQRNARDAGFELEVTQHPQSTFYGDSWCPESGEGEPPCFNASEFGIVDWGHRPTPDVYLTSALSTGGVWNASVYGDADFDALVTQYQGSLSVEDQTAAISQIQAHLHENVPASYPYFFNYLSANSKEVQGIVPTALGHVILSGASRVES